MEQRLDVTFGSEDRPRAMRIVGGPGLRLYDGSELVVTAGARAFLGAALEVAAQAPGPLGEWAKKCRASIPSTG